MKLFKVEQKVFCFCKYINWLYSMFCLSCISASSEVFLSYLKVWTVHFIGSILQSVVHELSTLNSFAIMFRPNELGICLFNKQLKVVIKHWSLRNSLGKQYYVNNTSIYIWHRIYISVHFKILICGLQISLTYYQSLVKSQFLRGNVCGIIFHSFIFELQV